MVFFILTFLIFSWLTEDINISGKSRQNLGFLEARYIVALLAKVAKSDGRVNEAEATFITQMLSEITRQFNGSNKDREELKKVYEIEKESVSNAYNVAFEYRQKFRLSTSSAIGRIHFFLNVAYIDGDFSRAEKQIIGEICDGFGINIDLKAHIFAKFDAEFSTNKQHSSSKPKLDPYKILGLDRSASFDDIKKQYRGLVRKYHPDILIGRGVDEEIVEAGTKKLQEINEAYEEIKKERGM
ncbi:MAG: DnaJ domain-containing protein [Campylobacter sp.]|nr:DnaJ domain-containing protein [Campylobacter sp.]